MICANDKKDTKGTPPNKVHMHPHKSLIDVLLEANVLLMECTKSGKHSNSNDDF